MLRFEKQHVFGRILDYGKIYNTILYTKVWTLN